MNKKDYQDKIRVLFVSASTKGGGAERMLFNIIHLLDKNRIIRRLFVTSDEQIPPIYANEITVINANKKHAVDAFTHLLIELYRFRPHYVFTTSSNIGYMLVIAKKLLFANYGIYIRCAVSPSEIYQNDIKTRFLNQIIKMTYNSADLIIAQTDFMRNDLIHTYNITPKKVRTIRNIVNIDFVTKQSQISFPIELNLNNYNIVAAGALYSVKGFDLLIDAIAPLIVGSYRHLYILGEERYESGYKAFLQKRIEEKGLLPNIHLIGHKDNPYPYFKKADLLVLSSRKEGYPNVVLEALALGTPVVATDVVDWNGVIKEGRNGYVAMKENINSLRSMLQKAFNTKFELEPDKLENFNYNELFL